MASFLSEEKRFKQNNDTLPGPGSYNLENNDLQKPSSSIVEVPFYSSQPRFKPPKLKYDHQVDPALIKKHEHDKAKLLSIPEYVNQTSCFSSNIERFPKQNNQIPPPTDYQPESFTDKLIRKIDDNQLKRETARQKKQLKQKPEAIKGQHDTSNNLSMVDQSFVNQDSKLQLDQLGFQIAGQFRPLVDIDKSNIDLIKKGVNVKKDFQHVSRFTNILFLYLLHIFFC